MKSKSSMPIYEPYKYFKMKKLSYKWRWKHVDMDALLMHKKESEEEIRRLKGVPFYQKKP